MTGYDVVFFSDGIIIIAQGKDVSGDWMELIIPILVVIGYAIVGILRSRSSLSRSGLSGASSGDPRYKPIDNQWEEPTFDDTDLDNLSEAEAHKLDANIERQLASASPKPVARHVSRTPTTPEQRRTLDAFLRTRAPDLPVAPPQREPVRAAAARPAPATPPVPKPYRPYYQAIGASPGISVARDKRKQRPVSQPAPVPQKAEPVLLPDEPPEESSLDILERITDPNELRRAIIYAEILGEPVGFRDM